MTPSATRVELPTIDGDEIGKIIMKKYNNTVQQGEVTHYFEDEKLYVTVYESKDNKKISHRLLNQYRCTNTDRDRTRQIKRLSTRLQQENLRKETKDKSSLARGKLPAHSAMAVYDAETRKMSNCKQLINHSNKQISEWWQKSLANKFEKLLKGLGKKDEIQGVKGSDIINFVPRINVSLHR